MDIFGASAPLKALQAKYGFTVDAVVTAARAQLGTAGTDRGSTSSEAPIGTHPTDPE
jgi:hypothetical protein